jgi:hypothetical protein
MYRRSKDQAFGFRIDPPHPQGDKHQFWHCQFMRSFCQEANGHRFPSCSVDWISDSMPAFPISLGEENKLTPVDMAAYAALCLYGKSITKNLRNKLVSVGINSQIRSMLSS